MAVTNYCTEDDLADRISQEGINLHTDDIPPDDLGAVIERASSKINQYCLRRYTAAKLALSDWVQETAADIAVYFLCSRRGNSPPGSVADAYEEAIKELEQIRRGAVQIADIPARKVTAPQMSNVNIRLRPTPHTRVQPGRSTNKPTDFVQRNDLEDPMTFYGDGI